jgi:hypothetical protein
MANDIEELMLIPHQDSRGYILRRTDAEGAITEIALTDANVLILPRVAHKPIAQILSQFATPLMKGRGVSPTIAVPVANPVVSHTVPRKEVILTLNDNYGGEFGFSFSPDVARRLGRRLIYRASKMPKDDR